MSSARANMAPEICFPTPFEESSSAIPPASIRREFPKSFSDGEKFGDGEKMDDVGRKSQFRCAASSPSFSPWPHVRHRTRKACGQRPDKGRYQGEAWLGRQDLNPQPDRDRRAASTDRSSRRSKKRADARRQTGAYHHPGAHSSARRCPKTICSADIFDATALRSRK